MADARAVAAEIGVTIPAAATVEHAERIAGRDDAARLVLLLPGRDWAAWRVTLAAADAPPASPDANFHLGPDEGGWSPGTATGLSTVQLPWRGGAESLNIGEAPGGGGRIRAFLFWHRL